MLKAAPIRAYIPASDVSRARKFYEQLVGLTPKEEYAGGVSGHIQSKPGILAG